MKIRKLLCFFGCHQWRWKLKQINGMTEPITDKIPDRAICEFCKKKYHDSNTKT